MNISLYDTEVMNNARVSDSLDRVVKYAVEHRDAVIPTEKFISMMNSTQSILQTPMAELCSRIIKEGAIKNITPIYIPAKTMGLPETLTSPSIVVDLKQARTAHVLKSIPEFDEKIIMNISSYAKQDYNFGYVITNKAELEDRMTLCHLVAAYADLDADKWLPSLSLNFLVKSYSIILSNEIGRRYQCSVNEISILSACIALYISQRLTMGNVFTSSYYNIHNTVSCTPLELNNISVTAEEMFKSELKAETGFVMNMSQLCRLIAALLGGRFEKINSRVVMECCGYLGTDSIISKTALEFPPYWAYLLFKAASSSKTAMTAFLKHHRLTNELVDRFIKPTLNYEPFLSTVRG